MNMKRYLYLCWGSLCNLALIESIGHLLLASANLRIIHKFVESFHVDQIFSFVDEDVSILNLGLKLLHHLCHLFTGTLEVLEIDVCDEGIIITSKSLVRYILWVKLRHQIIIELEPFSIRVFSILRYWDVMTLFRSSNVNYSTFQIVFIVLLRNVFLKNFSLFFIQVFKS